MSGTLEENRSTSFLYGGSASYVEALYEAYLEDPTALPRDWKCYFDTLQTVPDVNGSSVPDLAHRPVIDRFAELARRSIVPTSSLGTMTRFARRQVAVEALVNAYRTWGSRKARLDPLGWFPIPAIPELGLSFHGLSSADAARVFGHGTFLFDSDATLADLISALEAAYCGTHACEFMHLADAAQRRWWQTKLESPRTSQAPTAEERIRILDRLTAAETLERHLHTRYVGQTRFSLEGAESLIPLMDELIRAGATNGVRSVVMGMAHRGRLNVLVNVVGKLPGAVFKEFEDDANLERPAGDVKYHEGYAGTVRTEAASVEVLLAFNPSHLEFVNPVVQGIARARGEQHGSFSSVLPLEIHGEAAITGQGIVMETLSLTYTRGHGTGGTVHVVVNNQVGFTTSDLRDTRSSFYCTDIAKMIEAPILHVNGDDPQAVVRAARLAVEYRAAFARSIVIELVCFRRRGHQEQDTPDITQPLMYRFIAAHPGIRSIYAERLVREGVLSPAQVDDLQRFHRDRLAGAHEGETVDAAGAQAASSAAGAGIRLVNREPPTLERLRVLGMRITQVPESFQLHPLVGKVLANRRDMASGCRRLDWGMAEHLAFASLLSDGTDIRLSGQDSARGTFGHRHAVLHDQGRTRRAEGIHVPLEHVSETQGRFQVTNSILSEAAVMAFEYGYSVVSRGALVLWEAQYGDFANGAQVIIDQFLSAGDAKWGQRSGLVLLLPHGQEGQGPEHASARLERYLQLCAQANMRVCQPSTPAQFYHLLRAQAAGPVRPLIVLTPKSLLRHPEAVSSLDELVHETFEEILGDIPEGSSTAEKVERVILCTGKVYYDLLAHRRKSRDSNAAIIRIEQLYPLPAAPLRAEISRYTGRKSIVWCQEEPRNQGAWPAIEGALRDLAVPSSLRFAGPPAAASSAPGSALAFAAVQARLISDAFAGGAENA